MTCSQKCSKYLNLPGRWKEGRQKKIHLWTYGLNNHNPTMMSILFVFIQCLNSSFFFKNFAKKLFEAHHCGINIFWWYLCIIFLWFTKEGKPWVSDRCWFFDQFELRGNKATGEDKRIRLEVICEGDVIFEMLYLRNNFLWWQQSRSYVVVSKSTSVFDLYLIPYWISEKSRYLNLFYESMLSCLVTRKRWSNS